MKVTEYFRKVVRSTSLKELPALQAVFSRLELRLQSYGLCQVPHDTPDECTMIHDRPIDLRVREATERQESLRCNDRPGIS